MRVPVVVVMRKVVGRVVGSGNDDSARGVVMRKAVGRAVGSGSDDSARGSGDEEGGK